MDHTYQRPLQLPASYAVLSAEEMTYTEGGATFTEALLNWIPPIGWYMGVTAMRNYRKSHPNDWLGRYAFQGAVSGMQNALNDGLDVGDAVGHYWGQLNTWSKVASIGLAGLGGYYAYIQARSIYLSVKNLVTAIKESIDEYKANKNAAQQTEQQNCLPTLVALC